MRHAYFTSLVTGLCFFATALSAGEMPEHVPARVLYVKDGDTFRAVVTIWPDLSLETDVRIAHIDTPEKKRGSQCEAERQAGKLASDYAKSLLRRQQTVFLSKIRKGKYAGRIIAEVTLPDGRDYGSVMVKANHAIPYEGGRKRKVWCKGEKS